MSSTDRIKTGGVPPAIYENRSALTNELLYLLGQVMPTALLDSNGGLSFELLHIYCSRSKIATGRELQIYLANQAGINDQVIFGNPYEKLLLNPRYTPLFNTLFEQLTGTNHTSDYREFENFRHDFIAINPERFVQKYITTDLGRKQLEKLIVNDFYLAVQPEMLKSIARSSAGLASDAQIDKLNKLVGLTNYYFHIPLSRNDLISARHSAIKILKDGENTRERVSEALLGNNIATSFKIPVNNDKVQAYKQLAQNSNSSDPRKQLRARLAQAWLVVVNDALWDDRKTIGTRIKLIGQIEALINESYQITTEEDLIIFNKKIHSFINNGSISATPTALESAEAFFNGSSLLKQLDLGPYIQPFQDLSQISDEFLYAAEMGEALLLGQDVITTNDAQLDTSRIQLIEALNKTKRELWYGYKQHKALSRGISQAAHLFGNGDITDIELANTDLDVFISRLEKAKTQSDVNAIIADILDTLTKNGSLSKAYAASEMDGCEALIGTLQTIAITSALTTLTPIGGIAAGLEGVVGTIGIRMATSGITGMALVTTENLIAVGTNEVRARPDDFESWLKDAGSALISTGIIMSVNPQTYALSGNIFSRMGSRYAGGLVSGSGVQLTRNVARVSTDIFFDFGQNVGDMFLRNGLDGNWTAPTTSEMWESFKTTTFTGGFTKIGLLSEISARKPIGSTERAVVERANEDANIPQWLGGLGKADEQYFEAVDRFKDLYTTHQQLVSGSQTVTVGQMRQHLRDLRSSVVETLSLTTRIASQEGKSSIVGHEYLRNMAFRVNNRTDKADIYCGAIALPMSQWNEGGKTVAATTLRDIVFLAAREYFAEGKPDYEAVFGEKVGQVTFVNKVVLSIALNDPARLEAFIKNMPRLVEQTVTRLHDRRHEVIRELEIARAQGRNHEARLLESELRRITQITSQARVKSGMTYNEVLLAGADGKEFSLRDFDRNLVAGVEKFRFGNEKDEVRIGTRNLGYIENEVNRVRTRALSLAEWAAKEKINNPAFFKKSKLVTNERVAIDAIDPVAIFPDGRLPSIDEIKAFFGDIMLGRRSKFTHFTELNFDRTEANILSAIASTRFHTDAATTARIWFNALKAVHESGPSIKEDHDAITELATTFQKVLQERITKSIILDAFIQLDGLIEISRISRRIAGHIAIDDDTPAERIPLLQQIDRSLLDLNNQTDQTLLRKEPLDEINTRTRYLAMLDRFTEIASYDLRDQVTRPIDLMPHAVNRMVEKTYRNSDIPPDQRVIHAFGLEGAHYKDYDRHPTLGITPQHIIDKNALKMRQLSDETRKYLVEQRNCEVFSEVVSQGDETVAFFMGHDEHGKAISAEEIEQAYRIVTARQFPEQVPISVKIKLNNTTVIRAPLSDYTYPDGSRTTGALVRNQTEKGNSLISGVLTALGLQAEKLTDLKRFYDARTKQFTRFNSYYRDTSPHTDKIKLRICDYEYQIGNRTKETIARDVKKLINLLLQYDEEVKKSDQATEGIHYVPAAPEIETANNTTFYQAFNGWWQKLVG